MVKLIKKIQAKNFLCQRCGEAFFNEDVFVVNGNVYLEFCYKCFSAIHTDYFPKHKLVGKFCLICEVELDLQP
jgi:hypothetical protein